MWGQADASRALRGRKRTPAEIQKVVGVASVGREAGEAYRRKESVRGSRPQARDHHASHVGRRDRLPVRAIADRQSSVKDRLGVAVCSAEDVGKVSPSRSLYGARIKHALSAWTT